MSARSRRGASAASSTSGVSSATSTAAAPAADGRGPRSETEELALRVEAVDRGMALAGGRVEPAVADAVRAAVDGVRARLALGVDHTVVALVGGTGSGKSSLFNAISGLEFADVGVRRPTTADVTACVWGASGALLDWLEVRDDRRIERESELDADSEAALRGLVLLDLPDHDSVEVGHRVVVDRLLPMVDLLVWVVDPQKYADDALHSGYLRQLAGHEDAMVVVLNQMDTVPVEVHAQLAADVARLLREDGLVGVRVALASARSGSGIASLRALLADVVARRSTAAVRAGAEIRDAALLLGGQVAAREPGRDALPIGSTVEALAQAAGLPAVADALEAVVRGGGSVVPAFGAVQTDTVDHARATWLAVAGSDLPEPWRRALADRIATTDVVRRTVNDGLAQIGVAARRSRGAAVASVACLIALVVALAAGAVVAVAGAGADSFDPWAVGGGAALRIAIGAVAVALICGPAALVIRRRDARRRAGVVRREGRAALDAIVEAQLVVPTLELLGEHREVRELAATAARREPPTATRAPSSSPG